MSDQILHPPADEPRARPVGGTEHSWCRSVPGGTGTTVLGLLLSKPPDISHLQSTIHKLQNSHPILRSKIHYDLSRNDFSFFTPPSSQPRVQIFDITATARVIESHPNIQEDDSVSDFHKILEHEINLVTWRNPKDSSYTDTDVMFSSVYTMSEAQWAVFLRLHTSACDRAAAATLLRELLEALTSGKSEDGLSEIGDGGEVNLGIEDLIPNGKANKAFWARGLDMLGYSLNSFRLANLEFRDTNGERSSQVIRLKMNSDETQKLIDGCKVKGIKPSGALAGAVLIATRCSKDLPTHQKEKYGVVTLTDCRPVLDTPLTTHHFGFYHSAILNTHDVSADETLWDVANRCHFSFSNAKDNNKHFTDMADLNFLMCRAIDNPGLTPLSSMRTALVSVFEDSVIDSSNSMQQEELGLEDYIGCASIHGVGPSIALFHTVRDGQLDCACVYPAPLFSREQMSFLVDEMKKILVNALNNVEADQS